MVVTRNSTTCVTASLKEREESGSIKYIYCLASFNYLSNLMTMNEVIKFIWSPGALHYLEDVSIFFY